MAAPRYLNVINGVITQVPASETSAAEVIVSTGPGGTIDPTFMPAGVGVETITATASEAIAAGAFVNIWNNAGTVNVRNASASAAGKEAHGYCIAAFASSATATIYLTGRNTAAAGAPATAGDVYLSTTAGQCTLTAPTGAGNVAQQLGVAYGASLVQFNPGPAITLA